jgi:hypothetical protein
VDHTRGIIGWPLSNICCPHTRYSYNITGLLDSLKEKKRTSFVSTPTTIFFTENIIEKDIISP